MSLNNSVLTRASKPGEFAADAVSFRTKEKRYVQAVKYYGVQRGRPIFSTLPGWLYDLWLGREPGPITTGKEKLTFLSGDNYISILKGNYIVQLGDGKVIEVSKDIFEYDYQPIISAK
jgi:hypothetical protein